MRFRLEEGGVPPGQYKARYRGAKVVETKHGRGVAWGFELLEGEHAGDVVTRTTSDRPTLRNQAGRMLLDIAGVEAREGLELDEVEFRGQEFTIEVGRSPEGGGTRVERIIRGER